MLSNPLVSPHAMFANGLDIKNCDFTVFSSIKCEGTTIKDIKNTGTSVSTRNQARLFLVFTTTFFPMAARNADQNESNTSLLFFIAFGNKLSLSLSLSLARALKKGNHRDYFQNKTRHDPDYLCLHALSVFASVSVSARAWRACGVGA
tara:strand:- start:86 stop:529 length:444 start_codon:yes stop_codon:yes gene_type:complete